ncbi:MAG: HAD family hydrolase [Thermoplasmata archaeon]|nr:HAD family hydrolase [Thermoplasmata archaeon]MCI4338428.1 HAD family hydrolase [Thermoplasmata archaeon]
MLPAPTPTHHAGGRPVVYVDRDGTINPDFHYLAEPDRIEILEGVTRGIRELRDAGFCVVCVTNQSGVARGLYTEAIVESIHARIQQRLAMGGASIDRFYYCPHAPTEGCDCRKPGLGLFLQAERELGLRREGSAIIGDRWLDIAVGQRLGILRVLVPERGLEAETEAEFVGDRPRPDSTATNFLDAARYILDRRGR